MGADLNTSLVIRLGGNLAQKAREYGDALARMGQRGTGAFAGMRSSGIETGRVLELIGSKWTAIFGGVLTAAAVKRYASIKAQLAHIGVQTGRSNAQMEEFDARLLKSATAAGIAAGDLRNAAGAVAGLTNDYGLMERGLEPIATVMGATGTDADTAAQAWVLLHTQMKLTDDQARQALATMVALHIPFGEFIAGAAELNAAGQAGPEGFKGWLALAAAVRRVSGDSATAEPRIKALTAALTSQSSLAKLKKWGVELFDQNKKLKSMPEMLKAIFKVAGGNTAVLAEFFPESALDAVKVLNREWQATGDIDFTGPLAGQAAAWEKLQKQAAQTRDTTQATFNEMGNRVEEGFKKVFGLPVEKATKAWNGLSEALRQTATNAGLVATAGATIWAGAKGAAFLFGAGGAAAGGAAAGGAARAGMGLSAAEMFGGGAAAGAAAGAVPAKGLGGALKAGGLYAAMALAFAFLWDQVQAEKIDDATLREMGLDPAFFRALGRVNRGLAPAGGAPDAPPPLKGLLEIRIGNAPPGTKVTKLQSNRRDIVLESYMGQQLEEATP